VDFLLFVLRFAALGFVAWGGFPFSAAALNTSSG